MIKLKTASEATGGIHNGEDFVAITGEDATTLRAAAAMLGIGPEQGANEALLVFVQKNGGVSAARTSVD